MNKVRIVVFSIMVCVVFLNPAFVWGEENELTLTIAPAFFRVQLSPGETWKSTLKVTNPNPYDLELVISSMNFRGEGESDRVKLVPVSERFEIPIDALTQWIEIPRVHVIVKREKSVEIPFAIRIPENASPGGHYGALVVEGRSVRGKGENTDMSLHVSEQIVSMLLLRVNGDVREEGLIREFSVDRMVHQKPDIDFTFRFENAGNVHIVPEGGVVVYDMWGNERGRISLHKEGETIVDILPRSIRSIPLKWVSNVFELGLYRAEIAIQYGTDLKNHVSNRVYFFIFPPYILEGLVFIGTILIFLLWGIRLYIKKVMMGEVFEVRGVKTQEQEREVHKGFSRHIPRLSHKKFVLDLSTSLGRKTFKQRRATYVIAILILTMVCVGFLTWLF